MRAGLAPGDEIEVHMYDFPEVGIVRTHVGADGAVRLPYAGSVLATGKTPEQFQLAVNQALQDKGIVKDPNVTIDVLTATNMTVQVLGEVRTPKSLPIYSPVPISYILGQAGGTTGLASGQITLLHRGEELPTSVEYDANSPQMSTLNTMVQPGDIVSVSRTGVYFVAGEVNRPGIFPLGGALSASVGSPSGSVVKNITLLQALAQAGGITAIAARSKMRILRTENGKREEIIVDEVKLYKGEVADPLLHPNDILYVPSSYLRQTTNNIFSTAISSLVAATQLKQL